MEPSVSLQPVSHLTEFAFPHSGILKDVRQWLINAHSWEEVDPSLPDHTPRALVAGLQDT